MMKSLGLEEIKHNKTYKKSFFRLEKETKAIKDRRVLLSMKNKIIINH